MAVVQDYMNGACRIIVHDDCYKDKSQEEVKEIIDRVSLLVLGEELHRQANENDTNDPA